MSNILKEKKQKLKALISDAQRQRKRHAEKKKVISEVSNQSTSNASKLRKFTYASSGHHPSEDAYPQLHHVIVELATAGAGADFWRWTDVLNACKTLGRLCSEPPSFVSPYYSVLSDTIKGKHHIWTVPVKIKKTRNTLRNKHGDANFCFATK